MKGWGPTSFVCLSKPRKNQTFSRDIPGFWLGYPGGARKVGKKSLCLIFVPLEYTKSIHRLCLLGQGAATSNIKGIFAQSYTCSALLHSSIEESNWYDCLRNCLDQSVSTIGAKIITHTTSIAGELILQLHTHQLHNLNCQGINSCNACVSLVSVVLPLFYHRKAITQP